MKNRIFTKSSSFISQAKGSFVQIENDRSVVKQSDDISGYGEVYDKEPDTHFI